MKKGKGMRFVGDSRISADKTSTVPKDYSEYPGRTEAFWPNFLLKEWLVGSVFLVGFLCATIAAPAPLEGVADPTTAGYIPLPDWYFLFLYELLKYDFASGPYILFGILILPGLAFGALLLAPFLDNGPGRRPPNRPIAVGMMLLALASVFWLTYESASKVDWKEKAEANKPIPPSDLVIDTDDPGYAVYESSCIGCHGDSLEGGAAGPSLIGIEETPEEISKIAVEGIGDMPPGMFTGTDEELEQLVEFIMSVNEEAAE
ncbi:menaquinol-cytochrome c reductase cytochrome b/c subunit [Pseudogracilibacillus auburnensis]|uniref:menaquinol-cytochrome c reductase cytochrome b/c subunit n=1 Tax=Pseudogracilibacillus auburnensis TaxID=1494959 RepID=UPI001A95C71C|nr:menaquinol-cytochrome c reductase cytochrome b/c subunit [Pseudogracilibacillus auburnensis]MBO1003039.1 c-type cytochrome [Pseudogracilibacillus auburnensis]